MDWEDLRFALEAARAQTLSGAAKTLGVAQATASRRVAALEEEVGHVLFDRSRGGLSLTDAAHAILPHLEVMAEAALLASAALAGHEREPAGPVRVAVPPGIAFDFVPAILRQLQVAYPRIQLEVLSGNFPVDLQKREADVAIRTARPTHQDLVFRALPEIAAGAYASPAYLASRPAKPRADELDWIQYAAPLAHIPYARWVERHRGARPAALLSNDFVAMREAARQGLGVMVLARAQADGLVEIPGIHVELPDFRWYLVLHRAMQHVPRVRAVIEIIDAIAADLATSD